jgi:hypothetical protein
MGYQIRYTDNQGRARVHDYRGSIAGAEGWARQLSKDNGGTRAEAVHIADTHHDAAPQGTVTHVITVGDDAVLGRPK